MRFAERDKEFRPRIIVWSLCTTTDQGSFSTHECMLTIDGIARLAKPIIVFTGVNLLGRPDLYQIVEYGTALGMKIIVEVRGEDLTNGVLHRYAAFGPKLFRLIIDGCVVEGEETRYLQTPQLSELQDAIQRLKKAGYEIHLGATINDVNIRGLAFYHDFAFRSGAHGLFCHLAVKSSDQNGGERHGTDEVIEALVQMKRLSPANMYVSPQCVKYGQRQLFDEAHDRMRPSREYTIDWEYWCLGGKSFAFIDAGGVVRVCMSEPLVCGNLRSSEYDFKQLWETSEVFLSIRNHDWTCAETQQRLNTAQEVQRFEQE